MKTAPLKQHLEALDHATSAARIDAVGREIYGDEIWEANLNPQIVPFPDSALNPQPPPAPPSTLNRSAPTRQQFNDSTM